jgi:hypothetical protein
MPSPYEIWENTFQPMQNHLVKDAEVCGCLFGHTREEIAHVAEMNETEPQRVWTLVPGDDDKYYIVRGYRIGPREGYLVTEQGYDPNNPAHQRYESQPVLY